MQFTNRRIELQTELIVEKEQIKIEVSWDVDSLSLITTLLDFDDKRFDLEIDNLLLEIFNNKRKNNV